MNGLQGMKMLLGRNGLSDLSISNDQIYIPGRFVREVLAHALLVNIDVNYLYRVPVILAIQGPPGTGKSFQAKHTLEHHQIKTTTISSSSLAGQYEGDSISLLEEAYQELGAELSPSAIIVDDFDLSVGAQESRYEGTQNAGILNAFLMHLCDDPRSVKDKVTRPVPIILTGNNLSTLYKPLRRHGRMRFFEWIPDENERCRIVTQIFNDLSLQPTEISQQLLARYPDKHIAFFHQVKAEVLNELVLDNIGLLKRAVGNRINLNQVGINLIQSSLRGTSTLKLLETAARIDNSAKDYLSDEHQN